MTKSFDIVGYEFRTAVYCPDCIGAALPTGQGQPFDGWAIAPGIRVSAEDNLNEIAAAFGIDRGNETSFDSSEFPKVVFPGALYAGECCDSCKRDLTA